MEVKTKKEFSKSIVFEKSGEARARGEKCQAKRKKEGMQWQIYLPPLPC